VPAVGTNVTVHDLDASMEPTGSTTGSGLPLNGFITFSADSAWDITLTEILPGTDGTGGCTSGNSCTPPGSPFNLDNEAGNQVLVGFSFIGTATDGTTTSDVAGTFSTTFSDTTLEDILTDLNNGEAIVSSANATIGVTTIPTAPEPASIYMLLLGGALIMTSAAYRRRLRR